VLLIYFRCSLFSFSVLLPLVICGLNTFRSFLFGEVSALQISKSAIVLATAVLEMASDLQQIGRKCCRDITLAAS